MIRKSRFKILAIASLLGIVSLLAFHQSGYSLTGSANLESVKKALTPTLKKTLSDQGLQFGNAVFMRVFKLEKELEVWVKGGEQFVLFKTYPICTFSGNLGPKLKEGDRQAPEGFYFVKPSQMNPNSRYHLSFNLGYPNVYDRANGRTGSYLMIHGNCVSIGCFAMTDEGIEEIYLLADAALTNGQPFFRVHSFPFRLTPDNLKQYQDSEWLGFWQNLKQGYDYFEENRVPPNIEVKDKRYVIK